MAAKSEVDLRSRFPEITAGLDKKVEKAVGAGARLIAKEAQLRVPVRTGALKKSIHVSRRKMRARVIAGRGDVFYGHLVERGSARNVAPQPFLIPAFEATKDDVNDLIAAALRTL